MDHKQVQGSGQDVVIVWAASSQTTAESVQTAKTNQNSVVPAEKSSAV